MLVKTLQKANHQWDISESLVAACGLCSTEGGCCAILRHGILEVVECAMQQDSVSVNAPVLSQGVQVLCAELLAAICGYGVSKGAISIRPTTALVIINAL